MMKDRIFLYLKGMAMGAADIIPGVSGGTIALITGIYEQLVAAIHGIRLRHVVAFFKLPVVMWRQISRKRAIHTLKEIKWNFLITLLLGILTSVLLLSRVIPWFLDNYPFHTYSFFFGLIVFSIQYPYRKMKHRVWEYVLIIVFALLLYFLTSLNNMHGSADLWYIFLSGAIAITAMILPGISGSYILVLLGEYKLILNALHEHNFLIIGVFIAGILTGIFSFIQVLSWLLKKFHSYTMAALTGIMIGSLSKIWPPLYLKGSIEKVDGILFIQGIMLAIFGMFFIGVIDFLSRKIDHKFRERR